jgi:mannose-6-phosphate isomerase
MSPLQLPSTAEKQPVFEAITAWLDELGLKIANTDFDRPWGGFFVIADESGQDFLHKFFPGFAGVNFTPKILVAEPGKRLSWQYHHRRAEHWNVLYGPVGVVISATDAQNPVRTLQQGETLSFDAQIRHRLIGLEGFGVVAEIWEHTDPAHPSDDADIVRVADDFSRAD